MKNLLSGISLLFLLISCNSPKENKPETELSSTANTEPKVAKVSGNWIGTWEISGAFSKSTLEITNMAGDSMAFAIIASSGAHTGEIEGFAKGEANKVFFVNVGEMNSCVLAFELEGDSIIHVKQQSGQCSAGLGVYYSGRYLNSKLASKLPDKTETLVTLGILQNEEEDSAFRSLVGKDYDLFLTTSQLTSADTDLDSLHAKVYASGIRGLFTQMENIILIDEQMQIWAAVLDEDNVYYYTNSALFKTTLPKTIEKWRENFLEKKVLFKNK